MQRILHHAICNSPEVQNLHNCLGSCLYVCDSYKLSIMKLGIPISYKPTSADLQQFIFLKPHKFSFDIIVYSLPTPCV